MPEGTNEVTTAVTAESVTTVIPSNEEVISQIASEAVSEAMENAGVSFSETAETNAETTAFSTVTQKAVETEAVTEITEAEVTESVTVLPPETAAVVTEPTAETTTVTAVNEETPQQNSIPPQYIFIPLLIVILAFAAIFVKKNSVKSKSAEGKSSAKARDIARLEAAKSGKSKKKDKADKSEKEKKNLSKKVLDTIPYKKVLADNIWFLGKKMYSKAYTFDDINFKPSDERIRERMEKKFYHIDRNTEKKEQKIERSKEKYKKKLAKKQEDLQRNQQKKIFIKHNKNNPSFGGSDAAKKTAEKAGKGKLMLILGTGSGIFMVILIIIILLMIIASVFSWLTPYDYSLAGDESEEPTIEAKTNAEIIDGYALMIQNYMDVTQAYFYFDYGDWYGGVYDYPAPESFLSFSDYFTELQKTIIDEIQAKYEPLFASATSPEQMMAISQAMSREITAALEAAAVYAREDYLMLMESLDDCMTPEEHRQHYEIHNKGGLSGERDSSEFTGKPIIGTNHFDDVEFDSELSAEEILSMVALYKSFLSMEKPDEEAEGGETEDTEETEETFVYNITPQDIMDFFEKTEYITVTTDISENNACSGNCKRILEGDLKSGYYWTYYCDNDHLNLTGVVNPCKTKDELIDKIMELTDIEEQGIDKEDCEEMVEAYIDVIKKELDISEADYRQSGKADNERAKEFYEMLIDPSKGVIPNNYWTVHTELSE